MTKAARLARLRAAVFSDDWATAKSACQRLFHFGGRFHKTARRKQRQFLLAVLDGDRVLARNAAALVFRANRYHPAVIPLLRALQKPENSRTCGTLAYALEQLNCRRHLGELFEIVFGAADNYEVLMHVLTVLEEQVFEFSREELAQIAQSWEQAKPAWNEFNGIEEDAPRQGGFDQSLIQEFVDGYLAHLK